MGNWASLPRSQQRKKLKSLKKMTAKAKKTMEQNGIESTNGHSPSCYRQYRWTFKRLSSTSLVLQAHGKRSRTDSIEKLPPPPSHFSKPSSQTPSQRRDEFLTTSSPSRPLGTDLTIEPQATKSPMHFTKPSIPLQHHSSKGSLPFDVTATFNADTGRHSPSPSSPHI